MLASVTVDCTPLFRIHISMANRQVEAMKFYLTWNYIAWIVAQTLHNVVRLTRMFLFDEDEF